MLLSVFAKRSFRLVELGPFANQARKLGKRARTRARLMDAAVGIFAREGFEAASVNRIAQAADVVSGTFYLHFKDKDEIAAAVVYGIAGDLAYKLDQAMKGLGDAIERTSCATRRFIDFACARPEWGWALFRAVLDFRELRESVVAYLRADLKQGVAQGVFTVEVDEMLIDTYSAMTMSAVLSRLLGSAGPEAGSKVAELQLRMLGVPAKRAKKAAWRNLPPVHLGPELDATGK
jgi:AcrR family transcriptional regulator